MESYAWVRLAVALLLSTIGGAGMWSVVVVLPSVQGSFAVARGDASIPYTLTMICFGVAPISGCMPPRAVRCLEG